MKKQLVVIAVAACLTALTSCSVEGGYIETRPANVVYTRPVSPGADYIWIDGDWGWSGGRYVWHEGRWSRPRGVRTWEGGRWESGSRGWRWRRGHWR